MEKSASSPLRKPKILYDEYKNNKEEGDKEPQLDMIKFMENYKRGCELYNSSGLQGDNTQKEKK